MDIILILAIVAWVLLILSLIVIFKNRKTDGTIIINEEDPMKETYTLEVHIPFGEMHRRKRIVFGVKKVKQSDEL